MFGCQALDPLLAEIFLDSPMELEPTGSPSLRTRFDVSTQTNEISDSLDDIIDSNLTSSLLGLEDTKSPIQSILDQVNIQSENAEVFNNHNNFHMNNNSSTVSTIASGKIPRPLIVPSHNGNPVVNSAGINSAPPYNFYFSYPTSNNSGQYTNGFNNNNMNNGVPNNNNLGSHSAGPFINSQQNAFFEASQMNQTNEFASFKFI